ncbi:QueT transporter family protein [Liquorilactobacillus uvarum]|uniref:QueT transporter family protein n=1 Tax=Liquorilactobacillus uvarum TaxID=303240 RepID=UPI00288A77B2|nr:QueT transporter family protein [Liquorilactobacillus uvarum]
MKNKNIRLITINGVLAAVYVLLTMLFASFSFGVIQVRIATALYQLIAYDKKYFWGMVLGVTVANLLLSPLGLLDILVGWGVTGLGLALAILINRRIKNLVIRAMVVGLCVSFGMVFVALELFYVSKAPFLITYVYLIAGQAVSQIVGYVLFAIINTNIDIKRLV